MLKATTPLHAASAALRALLPAALGALILAGCGLGARPYPLVRTFTLDPSSPQGAETGGAKRPKASLIVTAAPPPGAYEGKKLVFMMKSRELTADFYNELSSPPARAVADGVAKRLELSEPQLLVARSQGAREADWALEISLMDIYGDLSREGQFTAQMAVTATLSDLRRSSPRPAYVRDFVFSIPVSRGPDDSRAEALVKAYSEGVSRMAEELRPEIRRLVLGRR
ncbi:MAG: ABC-type transport auxiliary lipoprotein family protein [Deltaproteobacteria bacterium]|jgi:ABC-type uncharacterized transport system auxiliary subunit|nr:ABC-type transport auxiliary lipoprotein family protein [Deltaproteobacteria bacterium]